MRHITQTPIIAGVEITIDKFGRINLNALHEAYLAGNPMKHRNSKQPNDWLRLVGTKALITQLSNSEDLGAHPVESRPGRYGGTFAHEVLAIEYAGWISPTFRLLVNQTFLSHQRADPHQTRAQPPTFSRLEILQLALAAEEENQQLIAELHVAQPKAQALDRIATSDGSLCITNAAKDLQVRPKDLFTSMRECQWIYRRAGSCTWIAYQNKIQSGYLEHKVTVVERANGTEKTTEQVRITPKGLTKLSKILNEQNMINQEYCEAIR